MSEKSWREKTEEMMRDITRQRAEQDEMLRRNFAEFSTILTNIETSMDARIKADLKRKRDEKHL